ncbi:MAG: signal peptidase I [Treponema sp.]|jgi:signal peptidase I|nr:signal peptidase I [Treponema sp.]
MAAKKKLSAGVFILAGIALGIFVKLFVLDILIVSGTSMESTLEDGNLLAVNKLAYGFVKPFGGELLCGWAAPKQGDVIIYLYENKIVVKRCAAVAGDDLAFFSDGQYSLTIRGPDLPESVSIPLTEHQYQRIKYSPSVPEGMVLAVGDNYQNSIDSRDYGFVPVKNVLGKGLCQ